MFAYSSTSGSESECPGTSHCPRPTRDVLFGGLGRRRRNRQRCMHRCLFRLRRPKPPKSTSRVGLGQCDVPGHSDSDPDVEEYANMAANCGMDVEMTGNV